LSWTASAALATRITAVLRRPGWSCHALGDARQVADALRKDAPDVLAVNLGVAAYRKLLARRPKLPPSLPVRGAQPRHRLPPSSVDHNLASMRN